MKGYSRRDDRVGQTNVAGGDTRVAISWEESSSDKSLHRQRSVKSDYGEQHTQSFIYLV